MTLLDFAIATAEKAGKLILKERKNLKISTKENANDLVTNVDTAAEELIIKEILKKYPKGHGIIAEESSYENNQNLQTLTESEYIWIIDPIDGTTNFTRGIPEYAVSIGIMKMSKAEESQNYEYLEGELIAGVIFAPQMGEIFYAEKGAGSFLNGKSISVSPVKETKKAIFATGFPAVHRKRNLPYFKQALENCRAMRRPGAASLDLAYIACGRYDAFWEFGLHPWDVAAGALIVEEAGGKVSDVNGNQLDLFGRDILATNGKLHKQAIELFADCH